MFIVCVLVQFKMSVGKYSSVTLYKHHVFRGHVINWPLYCLLPKRSCYIRGMDDLLRLLSGRPL